MQYMKWSIDPEVRRVAEKADTPANPKTPTVKVSEEQIGRLVSMLFILEPILDGVAKLVEIVQIRFQQTEDATCWSATVRVVIALDSSNPKFDATVCIGQSNFIPVMSAMNIAATVKIAFGNRKKQLNEGIRRINDEVASIDFGLQQYGEKT